MGVERLERRVVLANAVPSTTILAPSQALIGSAVNFTVGFTNASASQAGYGPYVDLELPSVGAGGNNGINFGSATYLGSAVTSTVLTFDAQGHATHPYAKDSSGNPVVVSGTPGDQLVVLQLPFGSVTPGQPEADLSVSANLSNFAAVGTPLSIKVDGGFRYGNDPLDNPMTDPSIIGASSTTPITPTLVIVKATYLGPEQETATGPDFKQQYLVTATVAPGQTINNFSLSDALPSGLQFVSLDSSSANGSSTASTSSAPSTTTPGGTLTRLFDKIVGTGGATDASMKFTFHAPRDDASAQPVLNLGTGAFVTETDQARASGTWTPLNPAQSTTAVSSNTATDTITAKSLAVQKGVVDLTHPGLIQPGDVLQYTVNFQVSDFFAFQNALVSDVISDGQHFDGTFAPTLQVAEQGASTSAAFGAANYTVGAQNTSDGTTPIGFGVSNELIARAFENGRLLGGSIPNGGTGGPEPSATPTLGAATGTIVFHTVVQQRYDYLYPAGQPYVVEGDILTNNVSLSGNVLAYSNLAADGSSQTDTSGTSVSIRRGNLSESIYAINGATGVGPTPKVAAGDAVTYRIQYTLPTSNIDNFDLSSFLPLPIFNATTVTSFDNVTGGTAPAIGHAQFGPSDTFHALSGIVPTLGSSASANSLNFNYGTYHDPGQDQTTVDVLYTVAVSGQPFADGLFLTNQAHETEGSTNNGSAIANALVQLQLTEPVLSITKGAVAVDNPHAAVSSNPYGFTAPGSTGYRASGTIDSNELGTSPINGTVTGIDAGDHVTFALVVQNTGTGLNGAFDVTLKDALPSGFIIPTSGLNLSVTDGTGAALSVSNVGGGAGLFDQGIVVKNPTAGLGTLAAANPTSGKNILIVTYDLQAADSITPHQTITNTASLTNYSAGEGGPDFLTSPETASTTSSTASVGLSKAITATSQTFTAGTNLAIGEIATYTVTMTLPEGVTPAANLVDTLPAGLAIVGVDSITPSSGQVTSSQGSWSTVLASDVTVASDGSSATFNFGDITNTDRNNNVTDTLTIVYRVVALNTSGNQQGTGPANSAALTYTGGSASASAGAIVVVPKLTLTSSANKSVVQAGDTVTYTFTVANLAANGSGTDAYDVNLADAIPAGLTYVAGSLTNTAGTAPTSATVSGSNVAINFTRLALGGSSTFTIQATVDSTTGPYQTLNNPFNLTYTTLPGTVTTPESTYSAVSTERTGSTGDPGGSANNLDAASNVGLTTVNPMISKTILSTDLGTTTGTNVAIGETAQYQVTLTIPDGVSAGAVLTDTLPSGLALVSVDSITADSNLGTSVSGGFAGVKSSASVTNSGGLLTLNFGTITNANRNTAQAQTIVVTYTAVALNTAGNVANTSLQNSAVFAVQGGNVTAQAAALKVVLPVLKVTVTSDKATAQAGDTVTYTATVVNLAGNGSGADAYDVALTDLIPTGMTYVAGSLTSSGLGPTTLSDSGNVPSATYSDLSLSYGAAISFKATVDSTTGPYQTLTDSATATYTTLPGTVTTPQSSYNTLSTERTGNTSDPGGATNNLTTSGSAPVTTVLPNIGKVIVGTSLGTTTGTNVAIGEKVQYQVTVTVPDGVTNGAVLTDSLPAGLAFVSLDGLTYSSTLSTSQSGGFSGVQSSATVGSNGSSLSLNFGTITNSNRDTTQTQTIVLTYTVVVLNASGNTAGKTLSNSATFAVQGGSTTGTTPVTVVEPHVGVTLTPSPTVGDAGGPAITFTVVVSANSGTGADAYDVNLSDILPSGYAYVAGSLAAGSGQAPSTLSDVGGIVAATYADMAPGATSTLTFQAKLSANTTPGQAVVDSANVTYTSLPGVVTSPESSYNTASTERTGLTTDPGGAVNTYNATASATVTVNTNTVAGFVYDDANDDGTKQGGESGLAGVTVQLTGTDNLGNAVSLTTTTTASGAYAFNGLRPGSYAVAMTPPAGYLNGKDTVGTPFGGSNPSANHLSGLAIPLGTNAAGAGYNFAELRPASVAGKVFSDLNNNGAVDTGELGISGAIVTLTGTDDNNNSVNLTLTTDSNGNFSFTNLRPGSYTVTETQPAPYLQGKNSGGNSGGTLSGDTLSGVTLTEGKLDLGVTFGELAPASLSGNVYLDFNDDGSKQGGEPGLGNVFVTLMGTDDLGNSVNTTVVTSNGTYSFPSLRPGTYAVTEATPSGLLNGKATAGSLGGNATVRDLISNIVVSASNNGITYNLGVLPPANVAGFVYNDANNDGTKQSGEPAITGATVTLTGTDDVGNPVNLSATSGADGSYSFTSLEPGTYAVTATVPSGDLGGKATAGSLGGNAGVSDKVSAIPVSPGRMDRPTTSASSCHRAWPASSTSTQTTTGSSKAASRPRATSPWP